MRVKRLLRANSEWTLPLPFFRLAVKLNKFTQLALGLTTLTIRERNCYQSKTEKGSSTRGLILVKEPTPSICLLSTL
ncbi:hypothetical protein V6N12_076026 [Hibiscus sabdariffa]|uniref:Uncharacterized protein n=1 Tax=Hibiscus sabdariffa TaxID=183260 RepID=A0ABR2AY18_9ROSI